eukprot:1511661-Rhodomonas_salina.1
MACQCAEGWRRGLNPKPSPLNPKLETLWPTPQAQACWQDMTKPMANSYSPKHVESAWNAWWNQVPASLFLNLIYAF